MEIWEREKYDLHHYHRHYEASRPFMLWLEYLRLSPSIALAHAFSTQPKKFSARIGKKLPEDFDQVLKIYKDFRMQYVLMSHLGNGSWWSNFSEELFGFPFLPPSATSIVEIDVDRITDQSSYINRFQYFLENDLNEPNCRNLNHLVISVPLTGDKATILRQISNLLPPEKLKPVQSHSRGIYSLSGQRVHLDPLRVGLRMLWLKAKEPNIAKWRLGIKAGVSDTYKHLDPNSKTLPPEQTEARRNLCISTNRSFRNALLIMENAARGRFPCTDKIDIEEMDFTELNNRLKKRLREERVQDRHLTIQSNTEKHKRRNLYF